MNAQNNAIAVQGSKTIIYDRNNIYEKFINTRNFSHLLCKPLETEDYCIQSMPDVSPSKWHLAHTSWFFEAFILKDAVQNYKSLHPRYNFLFNSYYVQIGERFTRSIRGLLSRPTVKEVYEYREYVNDMVKAFIYNSNEELFNKYAPVIEIGINHEQQHQELILTDIKHVFSVNPLHPVYTEKEMPAGIVTDPGWIEYDGGIVYIGHDGSGFNYDNETPRHKKYLQPFALSARTVTNHEYMEFIEDEGYKRAELWLSDGFALAENDKWKSPLYWQKENNEWWNFTLHGYMKINPAEPVCHINYYEADAFARWKGCRLPREEEWEAASEGLPIEGNFADSLNFHPVPVAGSDEDGKLKYMFGNLWEWTMSPYTAYPGYKPLPGALGEYNGKFMNNQYVLRGGSCATPSNHIRNTYRNFFPPHSRWQFMGFRLAKDGETA
jgi:ergothioneine biosynthesis protein EgtB